LFSSQLAHATKNLSLHFHPLSLSLLFPSFLSLETTE
jgi:hypothetical protein